jgi:hypothetical protein
MGFLAWGKRLDDRLAKRWPWFDRPMPTNTRLGMIVLIVFGGQFLMRVVFRDHFGPLTSGFTVAYGLGTFAGFVLILSGRRKSTPDR